MAKTTSTVEIRADDKTGRAFQAVNEKVNRLNGSFTAFSRTLGVVAGAAGAGLLTRSIFDLGIKFESLKVQLNAAAGSVQGGASAMAFARKTADDLGLSVFDTATEFAKFSAATRGTAIEGENTRKIFTSVAQAARVLQLSTDDASGVFKALTQIVSKGTLSAEEIRGQMGERLPGAFQIAARSIGKTTQELGKMLQQGEVVSDEFLPKFAAELDKTFGEQAEAAKNSPAAKIQRLKNSLDDLQISIAQSGLIDWLTKAADKAGSVAKVVGVIVRRLTGADANDAEGVSIQLADARDMAWEAGEEVKKFQKLLDSGMNNASTIYGLQKAKEDVIEANTEIDRLSKKLERLRTVTAPTKGEDKPENKKANPFGVTDDALSKELEKIEESLLTQEERIRASYERRREIVLGSVGTTNGLIQAKADELAAALASKEQLELEALKAREDEKSARLQQAFAEKEQRAALEKEREIAEAEEKKQRLIDSFLSQEEIELNNLERMRERALVEIEDKEALANALIEIEKRKQAALTAAANKGVLARDKVDELSARSKLQIATGSFSKMFGAFGEFSKKMFKAQKVAAIAEGLVAIEGGVAKAMNLPYPLNLAAAANVAVVGAGIISNLRSLTSGSGGSSGGSVPLGGGSVSGISETNTNPQTIPENTEQSPRQNLTLNITGDFIDSRTFAEKVNSSLTELYGDNAPFAVAV